jgi:citrate lyase subunit beta/citryl-CoA lyase
MNVPGAGLARSYLYVPADRSERLHRALQRGADALIADLEDGVAPGAKREALENLLEWMRTPLPQGLERWIRVNPGDRGLEEIALLARDDLSGFCLPKISSPAEIDAASDLLDELEATRGREGSIALMPMIETARAVEELPAIAVRPRVRRLQLGELDLAADLGIAGDAASSILDHVRAGVLIASVSAQILPPLGGVSPEFRDLDAFRQSTLRLREQGFIGRAAIHPAQIPVIHEVYTPSAEEMNEAHRLLRRYDEALTKGVGVVLDDEGRMVDEAVVRHYHQLLQWSKSTSELKGEGEN